MIFEIHFFLFCFAQSTIWSYTCVYAKYYANITNVQWGTLAMLLPALALVVKPVSCSMADAHGIHRQVLIGALAVFGCTYGSLGALPFFKDRENHDTDTFAWAIICFVMCLGYIACAVIFCMNDALASNYARKHNKSYSRMRIYANSGWAVGALIIMLIGDVAWLPFRVLGCLILIVFITVDILILLLWPYPEDFEMFHDGSTVEQRKLSIVGPNTLALLSMNHNKPRASVSDIFERIKQGRSKSVGNLPRLEHPNITIKLHTTDLKMTAKNAQDEAQKEQKEYSNFQIQMILMKMIASNHKSFIRYIFLFTIFGIVQAMIWNYQLDYFKESVVQNDEQFEFISTLCMIAQSICGEILINIVASEMIRLFGSNANLSLALVSLGLRCFFYSNFLPHLGVFSVLISEALQGPSLGLYWVLIVDIGSNYALMVADYMPELKQRGIVRDSFHEQELNGCLRATMIGVMSSGMEGLGVALGSLLGGIISNMYNYTIMWNICAIGSISIGLINIGWDLCRKLL